jgi:hypothetical protein
MPRLPRAGRQQPLLPECTGKPPPCLRRIPAIDQPPPRSLRTPAFAATRQRPGRFLVPSRLPSANSPCLLVTTVLPFPQYYTREHEKTLGERHSIDRRTNSQNGNRPAFRRHLTSQFSNPVPHTSRNRIRRNSYKTLTRPQSGSPHNCILQITIFRSGSASSRRSHPPRFRLKFTRGHPK